MIEDDSAPPRVTNALLDESEGGGVLIDFVDRRAILQDHRESFHPRARVYALHGEIGDSTVLVLEVLHEDASVPDLDVSTGNEHIIRFFLGEGFASIEEDFGARTARTARSGGSPEVVLRRAADDVVAREEAFPDACGLFVAGHTREAVVGIEHGRVQAIRRNAELSSDELECEFDRSLLEVVTE